MANQAYHSSGAPICDVDFYGDAAVADPVPVYAQMLSAGPVVWVPRARMHLVCGHAAVTQVLRDHRRFRSGKGVSINDAVNRMLIGSTLNSDPPQHDATRAITFAPLSPKALTEVRARIAAEANALADRMVAQGQFDAAAELAPHLPLTIVRDLVGLGDDGKASMLSWGAATFELMGDPRDRADGAVDRLKALRQFLEHPGTLDRLDPDGWAARATAAGIAGGMDPARASELMRDYIAPSLDTTISAIGYGVMLFARYPEQWSQVRADRDLIRPAIEEIVRLNTPIKAFSRYVAEDCDLEGVNLCASDRVLIVFGAANRDPAKFPEPDAFRVDRSTRGHVGFGHGVHACLGMHLARLEMASLFEAFADRVERFDLIGPVEPAINSTIHALAKVPVRVVT